MTTERVYRLGMSRLNAYETRALARSANVEIETVERWLAGDRFPSELESKLARVYRALSFGSSLPTRPAVMAQVERPEILA